MLHLPFNKMVNGAFHKYLKNYASILFNVHFLVRQSVHKNSICFLFKNFRGKYLITRRMYIYGNFLWICYMYCIKYNLILMTQNI